MRRLFALVAGLLLAIGLRAQDFEALGARLEEYFAALAGESAQVQNAECDFLIESSQDSLVRQYVALKIYDHYLQSKIMGDEAVAVHVAEKWFLSGAVPMHSDGDLLNARVYVMFNQNSLIGLPAPVITLRDTTGHNVPIPAAGGYSVLYFYDTSCSTCRLETPRLRQLMEDDLLPLTVYAINVGDMADAWDRYRGNLPGAVHLWDPEHESDWQIQYGVLQTPWMFLIGPDGPSWDGGWTRLRSACCWRKSCRPGRMFTAKRRRWNATAACSRPPEIPSLRPMCWRWPTTWPPAPWGKAA